MKKDKQQLSKARKRQIVEAALKCFVNKGYYETTMDEIVKESGLSKGTLYWYFESKELLLAAAVDYYLDKMTEQVEKLLKDIPDYKSAFNKIIDEMMDDFYTSKGYRSMFLEYFSHVIHKEEIRKKIAQKYREWMSIFKSYFEDGIKKGELKDFNVDITVQRITATIEGSFLMWFVSRDLIDPKKVLKSEINSIINQIGNKEEA